METKKDLNLIIDAGTGNVRVALVDHSGQLLTLQRDNVHYTRDSAYPAALEFDPIRLWSQIKTLISQAQKAVPGHRIVAITASSQREGVVLIDANGQPLTGFPNHDLRGREWEDLIEDKTAVYRQTGRNPTALFSAFKLVGLRERYPDRFAKVDKMLSISDWIQYQLSGILAYEYAQASETLLLDVAGKRWSEELCGLFDIAPDRLPDLADSGTILGNIRPELAQNLGINASARVIVGGADTQLAIKSTQPDTDDIVIVSGTTTPITRITGDYVLDSSRQSWTNRHTHPELFILETNCGVTGLNFQQLKNVFYPNEQYEKIEEEINSASPDFCVASLGSLVVGEEKPVTRGGFVFDVPVTYPLTRAAFARSILWDIAFSIRDNFEHLCQVIPYEQDYVFGCGGGFQSPSLTRFISALTGKKIKIRSGFQHASVMGASLVCNETMNVETGFLLETKTFLPEDYSGDPEKEYQQWKKARAGFGNMF